MSLIGALIVEILGQNSQYKATMVESAAATDAFAATSTVAAAESSRLETVLGNVGLQASNEEQAARRLGGSLGGLITPTTLAAGAGLALLGIMAESIKAAIADQQGIEQLTSSLKANAPGWNGSTDAIEVWIASAEAASAFSKDDLRKALELLVGATHDVTKAESDLTIATNLARYRNIDLASATQLIVDVEAGRFKGLVQLGIATHKGETAQEALNAVNKIAAGQDTTYLGTAAGKMEVMTNQVHDLEVELGTKLLPVLEKLLDFLNKNLIPALNVATAAWDLFLSGVTAGGSKVAEEQAKNQAIADKAAADAAAAFAASADQSQAWADQVTRDFADADQAGQTYWNQAFAIQIAGQQAAKAAATPYYVDAKQRQVAAADERLAAQDQASLIANNHQVATLNAETKTEAALMAAANKASYALQMKAGFDAAVAYGQGLHQGQSNVDTDLKQLLDDIKNTLSVPKQVAKLEGELTSKTLSKALSDSRPQVKTDAIALTQSIMDQLTALGVNTTKLSGPVADALRKAMAAAKSPTLTAAEQVEAAVEQGLTADYYTDGYKTGASYVQGIKDALAGLPSAIDTAQKSAAKHMKAQSPPGPESALHDIDKWGLATGHAYIDGLMQGVSANRLAAAVGSLAGAFAPGAVRGSGAAGGASAALAVRAGVGGGGAGGQFQHTSQNVIQVDGRTLAEWVETVLFNAASGFSSGFQAPPGVTGA